MILKILTIFVVLLAVEGFLPEEPQNLTDEERAKRSSIEDCQNLCHGLLLNARCATRSNVICGINEGIFCLASVFLCEGLAMAIPGCRGCDLTKTEEETAITKLNEITDRLIDSQKLISNNQFDISKFIKKISLISKEKQDILKKLVVHLMNQLKKDINKKELDMQFFLDQSNQRIFQDFNDLRDLYEKVIKITGDNEEEIREFSKLAQDNSHGGLAISESIYRLAIERLYANGNSCKNKDIIVSGIDQAFLMYSVSRYLTNGPISQSEIELRDERLVDHESKYIKFCKCPDERQIIKSRGTRLTKISQELSFDLKGKESRNNDLFKFLSTLMTNRIETNIHNFRIISSFSNINFDNVDLVNSIRETPTEDIGLLYRLNFYSEDSVSLKKQIMMFEDTNACYFEEDRTFKSGVPVFVLARPDLNGYNNIQFENGKLFSGFFKKSSREGWGMLINNSTTDCYGLGYMGDWKNDKRHGKGYFIWSDGSSYLGAWENGKMNGQGVFSFPNNSKVSFGQWIKNARDRGQTIWQNQTISNQEIFIDVDQKIKELWVNPTTGCGRMITTDYVDYTGEFRNDIPHGRGTFVHDSYTYEGNVEEGKISGQGVLFLEDGRKFEGHFEDGIEEGSGTITYPCIGNLDTPEEYFHYKEYSCTHQPKKYEGDWANFQRQGAGTLYYNEEDALKRSTLKIVWTDDKANGVGIMTFKNEGKYEGNFLDGKMDGKGNFKFPINDAEMRQSYDGDMKDNQIIGEGTLLWMDGKKYLGNVVNGLMDGNGTLNFTIDKEWRKSYTGQFKNNKFHGTGTLIWKNGQKYDGNFTFGSMHGFGTLTFSSQDGRLSYKGEFSNNKFSGQGVLEWKNGNRYEGDLWEDLPHGFGTMTILNKDEDKKLWDERLWNERLWDEITTTEEPNRVGREWYSKHVGEFRYGLRHGPGKYESDNVQCLGTFLNNLIHGSHIECTYTNGEIYKGQMKFGLRHGEANHVFKAKIFSQNYKKANYHGDFFNGMEHGKGNYTEYEGMKYSGGLKKGRFFGEGILYFSSGVRYEGKIESQIKYIKGSFYDKYNNFIQNGPGIPKGLDLE